MYQLEWAPSNAGTGVCARVQCTNRICQWGHPASSECRSFVGHAGVLGVVEDLASCEHVFVVIFL